MASTTSFAESYSTTPTRADNAYISLLGSNSYGSGTDTTTNANAYPVVLTGGTTYSYEKWLQLHVTGGTFSSITSLVFWKVSGSAPANTTLNAGTTGNTTYTTAVMTSSPTASTGIPTSQGAGLSVGPTPITAAGYSNYVVMQLTVTASAASGNSGTLTFRFGWSEV